MKHKAKLGAYISTLISLNSFLDESSNSLLTINFFPAYFFSIVYLVISYFNFLEHMSRACGPASVWISSSPGQGSAVMLRSPDIIQAFPSLSSLLIPLFPDLMSASFLVHAFVLVKHTLQWLYEKGFVGRNFLRRHIFKNLSIQPFQHE